MSSFFLVCSGLRGYGRMAAMEAPAQKEESEEGNSSGAPVKAEAVIKSEFKVADNANNRLEDKIAALSLDASREDLRNEILKIAGDMIEQYGSPTQYLLAQISTLDPDEDKARMAWAQLLLAQLPKSPIKEYANVLGIQTWALDKEVLVHLSDCGYTEECSPKEVGARAFMQLLDQYLTRGFKSHGGQGVHKTILIQCTRSIPLAPSCHRIWFHFPCTIRPPFRNLDGLSLSHHSTTPILIHR